MNLSVYQWFELVLWLVVVPLFFGWMLSTSRSENNALGLIAVTVIPFVFFLLVGVAIRFTVKA